MGNSVAEIVDRYGGEKSLIVSMLQDIQAEYRYLPKEALREVCELLEIPESQIFSLATFYKAFSLEPRGEHLVHVCMGTACHVRGAPRILEKIERTLDVKSGETTEDQSFTLETVNCVGACALGPVVIVDGEYHGQMTSKKVDSIYKNITSENGKPSEEN
jgi:NADH-quinone oxidoreductase subunit E